MKIGEFFFDTIASPSFAKKIPIFILLEQRAKHTISRKNAP